MSVKSQIIKTFEVLSPVYGFKDTEVINSPDGTIEFYAQKPIWRDYLAVRVIILLEKQRESWTITFAETLAVYASGYKPELEEEYRLARVKTLSMLDFFDQIGRTFKSNPWRIDYADGLVAFFKKYDEVAEFYGCVPIFLKKTDS